MKIINISGVIGWDTTPGMLREALRQANGDSVEVHISSPGGFVSDGLEMFNLIRDYAGPIDVVLKGYAMSMGSYIPLAAPLNRHTPGKIKAESNAIYMIHNALGGVWGNHHKVLSYGDTLKGMSNMIAREYARRTGKALEDVQAMMDKETYLFGEQILEHGFVDEIIDTTDDTDADPETAKVSAQAIFTGMKTRMIADQERMESDLQQVARVLACVPAPVNSVAVQPPAAAGNTQEVQQMTVIALAALLAANPAAQAEHNALVASARAEGETAGVARVEARITAAAPFLANEKYPATVGATALRVVKGEVAEDTLIAVVAAVDAVREQAVQTTATTATANTPATPAAPAAVIDPAAVVSSDDALAAAVAMFKGGK